MTLFAAGGYIDRAPRQERVRPLRATQPKQLELRDPATREPLWRRTFSPVRRDSFPLGSCEAAWWSAFDPKDKHRFMVAAERFDDAGKDKGARRGALGLPALKVLRALLRLVDYRTGRLDPAINTLAEICHLARSTVVVALGRLRACGFVSWIRRFAPTGQTGVRGPQVEQASNAYRLTLPERAVRMIARLSPPPPECEEARRSARAADVREMAKADDSTPLGAALHRLQAIVGRTSAKPSASPTTGVNPGRSQT